LLLAGLFGGFARFNTGATRSFSHYLTFGITLAVFTNIIQFAVAKTKRSRAGKPFCRKWGPVLCLVLATFLALADLMRHLINDAWGRSCKGLEEGQSLRIFNGTESVEVGSEFNEYCHGVSILSMHTSDGGLTAVGWLLTVVCTWSGYLLLFVGIFWLISFPQKARAHWRAIRGARRAAAKPGAAACAAAEPEPELQEARCPGVIEASV